MQADFLEGQFALGVSENPVPGDGCVQETPTQRTRAVLPAPAGCLDSQPAAQVSRMGKHRRQEARPVLLWVVAVNAFA